MAADSSTKIVPIKSITVKGGRRPYDERVVQELMKSISKNGLLHPIVVYKLGGLASRYVVVAGAHRLKAHKRIGLSEIAVKVIKRESAEVAELTENLHRNDLDVLQRAEYVTRYAKALARLDGDRKPAGGTQPNNLGISRVARETRLDRRTISAAFRHSQLPKSVKSLLAAKGLANNFRFICQIDELKSEADQLRAIEDRCSRNSSAKPIVDSRKVERSNSRAFLRAFNDLEKSWKESEVRKLYLKASKTVRKAFIKKYF